MSIGISSVEHTPVAAQPPEQTLDLTIECVCAYMLSVRKNILTGVKKWTLTAFLFAPSGKFYWIIFIWVFHLENDCLFTLRSILVALSAKLPRLSVLWYFAFAHSVSKLLENWAALRLLFTSSLENLNSLFFIFILLKNMISHRMRHCTLLSGVYLGNITNNKL